MVRESMKMVNFVKLAVLASSAACVILSAAALRGAEVRNVPGSFPVIIQFELSTSTCTPDKIVVRSGTGTGTQTEAMVLVRMETGELPYNRKIYKYIFRASEKMHVREGATLTIAGRIYSKRRYRRFRIERQFRSLKNEFSYQQSKNPILRIAAWIIPEFRSEYTDIVILDDDLTGNFNYVIQ